LYQKRKSYNHKTEQMSITITWIQCRNDVVYNTIKTIRLKRFVKDLQKKHFCFLFQYCSDKYQYYKSQSI